MLVNRREEGEATIGPDSTGQSPGELVTWTLVTLLGISEVLVNERLGGTLRRPLITPTRPIAIILGKVAGRLTLGLLQMAILIGLGSSVFGVNWGRSPVALVLVVLAFALAAVALGKFLGALARTRQQAIQMTILCSMLLAALGGAWFPIEMAPDAFRAVASVLPTTWAMSGFNAVIMQGSARWWSCPGLASLSRSPSSSSVSQAGGFGLPERGRPTGPI